MLPSLLTRDIQAGLKQYLLTAYEPSDPFFSGIMSRFLDRDGSWLKGPYLQLGLPFRPGTKGRNFFKLFETTYKGFTHQEAAWSRLTSEGTPANTLVATGTGSGKTESFLYPILDYCARENAKGRQGIKALIIYPMNALATDQARRIAETINGIHAFHDLRAGLYVGGGTPGEPGGTVMTPASVITDRETLRDSPPDILLTNYKMLDYLLIRPRDRKLWGKNGPDTLRYIVVDELHTFDGAQGTDLALLLRRLKARLKTPPGSVVYVGTSATLGSGGQTKPLCDYAEQVFAAPFPPESVVTEDRLDADEFLRNTVPEHSLESQTDLQSKLDPARFRTQVGVIGAWFSVFFPNQPVPDDVSDAAWRQRLGGLLKRHTLFIALLKSVGSEAASFSDIQSVLARQIPMEVQSHIGVLLDAFLALAAWARSSEDAQLPLVTLRVQIWVRELRRMVAPLTAKESEVELLASSDLRSGADAINLPLIQCSECHTTGWLSRVSSLGESKISTSLEEIYNAWFGRAAEVIRLYPNMPKKGAQVKGVEQYVCASCGNLAEPSDECISCGGTDLVPVFRPIELTEVTRGTRTSVYHDSSCPLCGELNSQLLIGSRSTTLGSQVVERSWGCVFNDDRKLIAFSDSVQDAAHRAGFIGARTYSHSIRRALAKGIAAVVEGSMPWPEFQSRFSAIWHEDHGSFYMEPLRFVTEFIGPDMLWQREWTNLYHDGGTLISGKYLLPRVRKRLEWQTFAEFTYAGNRGRSLDRLGVATLSPSAADVDSAVRLLEPVLKEKYGINAPSENLYWWLWGLAIHLRQHGAVREPLMGSYPSDGDLFKFTRTGSRKEWLPKMGPRTVHPTFLGIGSLKGTDKIAAGGRSTWYSRWFDATIVRVAVLINSDREAIYLEAIKAMEAVGIVSIMTGDYGLSAGLNRDGLRLWTDVLRLQTVAGTRPLTVPLEHAQKLKGMPCLDAPGERYEAVVEAPTSAADWLRQSELRRVIAAEHTGLLERGDLEKLEQRFKAKNPQPWYENLLSATPTLELGVDIGDLSSVMLCSAPPTVASFMQRVGRAGRRDGNAHAVTLADGASPHDLYFYEEPEEMISGEVLPPGIFLRAPEVLRRQYAAFCLDDWVATLRQPTAMPDQTAGALDAVDRSAESKFPYTFIAHAKQNRERLYDGFIDLLGEYADDEVKSRLRLFVDGSENVVSMHARLLNTLAELAHERKEHVERIKKLRARRKEALAQPQDQATEVLLGEIDKEEGKYQQIVAAINTQDLLNTLTDAGLIPNYAFPEAGVSLTSLLYRPAMDEDNTTRKTITLPARSYERPASSALSEFAPDNRFYANQRRVKIDQIDMAFAKLEQWRLCPNCHHMQNLEIDSTEVPNCPRCDDEMWQDNAQKRMLLRFRQAIATSNDAEVRIDDSVEEREPKFYLRQMLVDFTPSDIREAWMLRANDLPFGFEFVDSASFYDINFGESGKSGEQFKVADRDAARPGFRLCRLCGKVQSAPKIKRTEQEEDTQDHSFDCTARGAKDDANILSCLYLYREFKSEALRILVPFTHLGIADPVVQSFSAALQLGLKRRYGGRVDHIRVAMQDSPDPEGGPKRRYLLLYDSVPGGTGYLHQMLAHDARTLKEIFQMALEAIDSCLCRNDPEKDGCYRCVYQYRLGRQMDLVSRQIALHLLRDIVSRLDKLERTTTISTIGLSDAIESVLERRFIECLSQLSKVEGLPRVSVIKEVVNGREGYHLFVGENKYTIEMQVDLGHQQGVKRPSRPDFVIRPLSAGGKRKPIAVFCDGWKFHKSIIRDDAAKRTAIINSGNYWIWSIVSDDVDAAIACKSGDGLPDPYTTKSNRADMRPPPGLVGPPPGAFKRNAIAELIHWLSLPAVDADIWVQGAWAASIGWLMRLVPTTTEHSTFVQLTNRELRQRLPIWLPEPPSSSFEAALDGQRLFNIHGVWPASVHRDLARDVPSPNVVWFDDAAETDDAAKKAEWRWWLWAFNWLQTMPGSMLVTQSGVESQDYVGLNPANAESAVDIVLLPDEAAGWSDVLEQVVSSMTEDIRKLIGMRLPPPDEVGFPLEDESGEELSMAELTWLNQRVVVLAADFHADQGRWQANGWDAVISVGDWPNLVSGLLSESERSKQ